MAVYIEQYDTNVQANGFNTLKAATFGSTLAVTGAVTLASTLNVTGATAFTVAPTGANPVRPITDSALVGATVALTAAQNGGIFNNRSTSGSPSWTLPTAANGLYYTFTCSNTTAGFTVTGGTINAKASATGAAINGTTLTHTQGTAIVGDTITLACDGTVWRMIAQAGIFAAA